MKKILLSPLAWVIALLIADILFVVISWYTDKNFLVNTGFLILGALLTVLTTITIEIHQRSTRAKNIARILHAELANLVARCCFDSEAPWRQYWTDHPKDKGFNVIRLRKFMPAKQIVFSSAASEAALLQGNAILFLIQFYYSLDAFRREIEGIVYDAAEDNRMETVATGTIKLVALRLRQTLEPGLQALTALSAMVPDASQIEASAISAYDVSRHNDKPKGTLRERIKALIHGAQPIERISEA